MQSLYTEQMMRGDSERSLAARRSRRHKEIEREYNQFIKQKKQRLISITAAISLLFTPLLVVHTSQIIA